MQRGKTRKSYREKTAGYKPRRAAKAHTLPSARRRIKPTANLTLAYSLQNPKTAQFCHLSHSDYYFLSAILTN